MSLEAFNNMFGDMDLELIDLILKGHFDNRYKFLDAGCGEGRNLFYFLQNDFQVKAIDNQQSAVDLTRYIFKEFGIKEVEQKVLHVDLASTGFEDESFDAIVCSRVLHFAEDMKAFLLQWSEILRILKTGGLLYCSMDSMIGFEEKVEQIDLWKWRFLDGSVRFLLSERLLKEIDLEGNFTFIQPTKTIHYTDQHAQTVLTLIKK